MRFEFKLRIGAVAVEFSDYDRFVPFQMTLWRYQGGSGHSICNLRWGHFKWQGWQDRSGIKIECTGVRFVPVEREDLWADVVDWPEER